ncbi:hypothetical protein CRUP_027563 [Coryphaenoides rupestris]|nr:hypothetical protein CRUP_027563 [Coryphaenoides rupestris]
MYCNYQDREELEDELYREAEAEEKDSEGSEVNSEVEFHLYSQLHYASDPRLVNGEDIVLEDGDGEEENKHSVSADPEQSKPTLHSKGGPPQRRELKRNLLKTVNPQRGKAGAKSLRSSWASLEEVIVIDSGTDIVCSEDDTEGVCTLKGRRWSLQTSTPAQQASEKRKRSPSQDSVVVLNSGSESDVSELDSDDSSEVLENWMILGQGNDVEDHSISLNLEGQSNNNTDCDEAESGSWLVSSKDRAAGISNQDKNRSIRPLGRRDSNRYYQDKNKVPSCMLCGTPGHIGTWCPNRHCNNCGLPGHLYEACNEKAYWFKKCHRYVPRDLEATRAGPPQSASGPQPGRTPAYCYNCSRKGHFGHWKTKRPVPATRAGLQATAPAPAPKHVFFKDEDFPRGGGRDEMVAGKRNKKRKKKNNNNNKSESSDPRVSPFKRESYTPEQLFGRSGASGKEKGRKAWKKKKSAKGSADSYPRDENLFAIKQRKRKK